MEQRLKGVKAVITGGAGAIGMATARAFLAEGASVYIADLDVERVDQAVELLGGPDIAFGGAADVTSVTNVEEMMAHAAERLGAVTTLINNAGTLTRGPLEETSEPDIDRVIRVNLKGVVICTRAAIPYLRGQANASVLNTSSQAGKRGWAGNAVYGATKAGVIGFSRAMAVELAPEIRVNSICPGHVRDEGMAWHAFDQRRARDESVEDFARGFARDFIPLQRLQGAEDIAHGFVYLASVQASEITGAALNIGGGVVMD